MQRIISKSFTFEAAHKLDNTNDIKNRNIHGHSFHVTVFIKGDLGSNGMILDFCTLEDIILSLKETLDHSFLNVQVSVAQYRKYIEIVVVLKFRHSVIFSEVIYHKIVCDPHYPRQKLSFFIIGTSFQGVDHLDKSILKNIFRYVAVVYFRINKTENSLLVSRNKIAKGRFIAIHICAN